MLTSTLNPQALYGACVVGLFNFTLISSLRNIVPRLFTDDIDVIEIVASVLPLCAAFQLFDALAANCNGLLRGLGRQEIGGYVNIFCYYVLAMPISFGTAFGLGWQLKGLWSGVALALGLVAAIEGWFLVRTDWEKAVEVRCSFFLDCLFSFEQTTNSYFRQHKIEMPLDDSFLISKENVILLVCVLIGVDS